LLTETALLFFTPKAALDAIEKTFVFAKNQKTNQKIASLFVRNTRKIAKSSCLPVFEVNELQQHGAGFGEKLANAIESVFDNGFRNVVVIGNDCPQLTVGIITNAAAELQHHDLVLGPDKSGGVYLIGLSKSLFNSKRFANAPWQTPHLLKGLDNAFSETTAYLLPALKDANSFVDLIQINALLPASCKLKALIISILAGILNECSCLCTGYNNISYYLSGLRAPPFSTSTTINVAS
jgi:glycosyltransferase A (GT-A) superfamily protein (DUF2064 family)